LKDIKDMAQNYIYNLSKNMDFAISIEKVLKLKVY
jgi:hypothetical protein